MHSIAIKPKGQAQAGNWCCLRWSPHGPAVHQFRGHPVSCPWPKDRLRGGCELHVECLSSTSSRPHHYSPACNLFGGPCNIEAETAVDDVQAERAARQRTGPRRTSRLLMAAAVAVVAA